MKLTQERVCLSVPVLTVLRLMVPVLTVLRLTVLLQISATSLATHYYGIQTFCQGM